MAGQAGDDAVESAIGDGATAEWAAERAAELDLEPHEFLERIMRAYRAAEDGTETAQESADEGAGEKEKEEEATEEVAAVRERVEALEDDVAAKIEDVRERVIQVKRETDRKAPADHEHETIMEQVEAIREETETLVEDLAVVEERLDGGFENYEAILEYLVDETDEMERERSILAEAVLDLRDALARITVREQDRARADRIKRTAAKSGVRSARCENCATKVDLALLSRASCPTCDATFRDLDPNPGFFGRSTLETGSRPALEAPSDAPEIDEIEAVAAGEGRGRPDRVDWFVGESEEEEGEDEDHVPKPSGGSTDDTEPEPEREGDDGEN